MAAPTIPLPEDVSLAPPGPDTPPQAARFYGCWLGSWGGTLPHLLVIERIAADGSVRGVYALGDSSNGVIRRQWMRLQGRCDGNSLVFENASVAIRYRLDAAGCLDAEYRRGAIVDRAHLDKVPAEDLPARLAQIPTYTPLLGETLLIPSHVQCEALGRPFNLAALFHRPPGKRRPPLVIFNHGSTGPGAISPRLVQAFETQARFFLARGFAFLTPMRRGRGASEGDYVEWYDRDPLKLAGGLRHALDDLDAVVAHMRGRDDVDGSRILVAGQSRGGILSVAYAGQQPRGVLGSINFSGGWISEHGMIEEFNRDVFVRAGSGSAAPALWLYAENDSFYDAAAIRRWHDGYTAAGGQAQLYLFAPVDKGDGHGLFDRPAIWQSAVDAFLHQLGFRW